MNILNGNEAFAALMSGKNIMCRAAGELMDFTDLDQFPATVFALSGYEFCVKRETLTLAEIQFTKPVEPHDLENGQEIYIVMPTCILRTQYDHEHGDICLSVANGFAQLDKENAKLQLQAFGQTFGNMITDIEVKDGFNDKPKKRTSRSKKVEPEVTQVESVKPSNEESLDLPWETNPPEVVETHKSNSRPADDIKGSVCNLNDAPSKEEIKPVVEQSTADDLYASFEYQIEQATTTEDLMKIRSTFSANGTLSDEQHKDLNECFSGKLADLNTSGITIIAQGHIDIIEDSLSNEEIVQKANEDQYQKLLAELIERAQKAGSPKEANALYKYTVEWTEEQRKPLMSAITKRLNELNADAPPTEEPPSLMVQIQNAPDLTTLDALEIDVSGRHPDIQPKLMGYVKARRFELENRASPTVS